MFLSKFLCQLRDCESVKPSIAPRFWVRIKDLTASKFSAKEEYDWNLLFYLFKLNIEIQTLARVNVDLTKSLSNSSEFEPSDESRFRHIYKTFNSSCMEFQSSEAFPVFIDTQLHNWMVVSLFSRSGDKKLIILKICLTSSSSKNSE